MIPLIPVTANICPPFSCNYGGAKITLGEYVSIDSHCVFLDGRGVTIGDRTLIGPNVQIYTEYDAMDSSKKRGEIHSNPISIGDDCFIGGGTIINAGVKIGNGCIVRAGSVVSTDIPDNHVFNADPICIISGPISHRN